MEEKFKREEIENYKKKCEEKLREKGPFKQINLLDEYKNEGCSLIIMIVLFIVFSLITNFLLTLGVIGEILAFVTSIITFITGFTSLIGVLGLIFYLPIHTIYQNKKHLKMSKIELEEELEKNIEIQRRLYDKVINIYDENIEITRDFTQQQREKIFNSMEEDILKKLVIGESISNFNIKYYLFFRKIELILK